MGLYFKFIIKILTLLRNPIRAPKNVNGTDTQNHKNNKANKVENGIAAELFLAHKTRFIMKNKQKTTLKNVQYINTNYI